MNAKELMIGDWVSYYETLDRDKKIRIESIIEEGVNLSGGEENLDWFDYDKIEPIPLTAEIFELNDFAVTSMVARLWEDYIVEYCFYDNSVSMKNGFNTLFKKCTYVHELQHALRLCGLNKLADNFKVE